MSRLEMTLWTLAMFALAATTAKGAPRYSGPPVREAHALSIELARQAAALSYDVERLLCDCNDYDDVLEELCDLADELDDLNATLRDATFQPRKWRRVCKRAEDVLEEVGELDEEIHEAVDDLNRYRPRQTTFQTAAQIPRGLTHYRSVYRRPTDVEVSVRLGTSTPLFFGYVDPISSRGVPRSAPYRGAVEGFARPRLGCELEERVHQMQALAEEIHRLAHAF